jgi:hypothetical protein
MDSKQEARVLFSDYNRWRLQTGGIERRRAEGGFIGVFKETPERLALFEATAKWCREKKIDPRLWIYLLFRARSWSYAPRMEPGHLMSENMLERYESLSRRALDGYRAATTKTQRHFDPNVDISHAAEALKRQYAAQGQQQRCMRETLERTLGYHPKSSTCLACPMRGPCERQLAALAPEFDIVMLRRGEISVETARRAVEEAAKKQ